jgi:adenine-specific DNA-methyltransferase
MSKGSSAEMDLGVINVVRIEAIRQLDPKRKAEFAQFMTPAPVARFMASLFSERKGRVGLLDAGAGVGSLTGAFIERWGRNAVSVSAYEVDSELASYLRETLSSYGSGSFEARVIRRDFIEDAVSRIENGNEPGFTHAILNPPY